MMMAKLLALVLAVLMDKLGYQIPGGQAVAERRTVGWVNKYTAKVMDFLNTKTSTDQSFVVILALALPLCLIVGLLELFFFHVFGDVIGLLFVACVLFYLLGNPIAESKGSGFVVAHERSFGVLFWFALLGPVGALLYWFFVISKQSSVISQHGSAKLQTAVVWVHAVLAWIPARITGFIYALLGNFTSGFSCWLTCIRNPSMGSGELLEDCGRASTDAATSNDSVNLVNRSFIAWVVLTALIVIKL